MANKRYGVIVADPPWQYRNGGNGAAANHYPTMPTEQIAALPVANFAHDATVLLMWATWPHLESALEVGNAWRFAYVTGFPWIKVADPPWVDLWGRLLLRPKFGVGQWVRGATEVVLIWRMPKARPPATSWLGILSERMQHSRKPESLHEYAESMPGPYLELFARRARAGWDVWGNEVASDVRIGGDA